MGLQSTMVSASHCRRHNVAHKFSPPDCRHMVAPQEVSPPQKRESSKVTRYYTYTVIVQSNIYSLKIN